MTPPAITVLLDAMDRQRVTLAEWGRIVQSVRRFDTAEGRAAEKVYSAARRDFDAALANLYAEYRA